MAKSKSTTRAMVEKRNSDIAKTKSMAKLMELKPSLFKGGVAPSAAESWLEETKSKLETIGASREDRVTFATYLLDGPAEDWWESQSLGYHRDTPWDLFEAMFRRKYVLSAANKRMVKMLQNLKQNDCSVSAYHARFVELVRHDPVRSIETSMRCAAFKRGLRPGIKVLVSKVSFDVLEDLVATAARIEADHDEISRKRRLCNSPFSCFLCRSVGHLTGHCPYRQSGEKSVEEYRESFAEIYGGGSVTGFTENLFRVIKFRLGLRPDIRAMLQHSQFRNLNKFVKAAKRVEAKLKREQVPVKRGRFEPYKVFPPRDSQQLRVTCDFPSSGGGQRNQGTGFENAQISIPTMPGLCQNSGFQPRDSQQQLRGKCDLPPLGGGQSNQGIGFENAQISLPKMLGFEQNSGFQPRDSLQLTGECNPRSFGVGPRYKGTGSEIAQISLPTMPRLCPNSGFQPSNSQQLRGDCGHLPFSGGQSNQGIGFENAQTSQPTMPGLCTNSEFQPRDSHQLRVECGVPSFGDGQTNQWVGFENAQISGFQPRDSQQQLRGDCDLPSFNGGQRNQGIGFENAQISQPTMPGLCQNSGFQQRDPQQQLRGACDLPSFNDGQRYQGTGFENAQISQPTMLGLWPNSGFQQSLSTLSDSITTLKRESSSYSNSNFDIVRL